MEEKEEQAAAKGWPSIRSTYLYRLTDYGDVHRQCSRQSASRCGSGSRGEGAATEGDDPGAKRVDALVEGSWCWSDDAMLK